jgi:hypothetical protein
VAPDSIPTMESIKAGATRYPSPVAANKTVDTTITRLESVARVTRSIYGSSALEAPSFVLAVSSWSSVVHEEEFLEVRLLDRQCSEAAPTFIPSGVRDILSSDPCVLTRYTD